MEPQRAWNVIFWQTLWVGDTKNDSLSISEKIIKNVSDGAAPQLRTRHIRHIFPIFSQTVGEKCSTGNFFAILCWKLFHWHLSSIILRYEVNWTDSGFRIAFWSSMMKSQNIGNFWLFAHLLNISCICYFGKCSKIEFSLIFVIRENSIYESYDNSDNLHL